MSDLKFNYNQLARFSIGQIVADTTYEPVTSDGAQDIGYIVGLSVNAVKEVILRVEFILSGVRLIHPSNVTIITKG